MFKNTEEYFIEVVMKEKIKLELTIEIIYGTKEGRRTAIQQAKENAMSCAGGGGGGWTWNSNPKSVKEIKKVVKK